MTFLIFLFSFLLLIFGILIFTVNNPVYSVLLLILNFILASFILFLLNLDFIALVFIMIYVGAVAVLFLFVIMMITTKEKISLYNKSSYFLTLVFFELFIGILIYFFFYSFNHELNQNHYDFYSVLNTTLELIETAYLNNTLALNQLLNVISAEKFAALQNRRFMVDYTNFVVELTMITDEKSQLEVFTSFKNLHRFEIQLVGINAFALSYHNLFFSRYPHFIYLYHFITNVNTINDKLYFDFIGLTSVLGQTIYNSYGLLFLIAGFILLIALIGPICLTFKFKTNFLKTNRPISKNDNINKF